MKLSIIFLFLLITVSVSGQNWELVWSDEFNGKSLDTNIWNYETGNGEGGWGTGQMDYCTDRKKNVAVKDGKLIIGIRKEHVAGYNYTSGRINSKDKYFVKYGKVEARMKIPAGRGIGAAFWMLPQYEKYGWWPRSGEIDILEVNGHERSRNYGTVHYMQWESHQYKGHDIVVDQDLSNSFHNYTIIWNENSITWFLDDSIYNVFDLKVPIDNRKPFNEDFFIIISAGVGSDFSGKIIEDSLLPQTFEVDYVRVYNQFYNPKLKTARTSFDGKNIELVFTEELIYKENMFNDFLLEDNGEKMLLTGSSLKFRDNRTLILNLNEVVRSNSSLIITYNGSSIKSSHNQPLLPFYNAPVVNHVKGAPPVLERITTLNDSYGIELTFSKELSSHSLSPEIIKVKVNGNEVKVASAGLDSTDASKVFVRIYQPLFKQDTILISCLGDKVESTDKGILKPFSDIPALNCLNEKSILPGKIEAENFVSQKGLIPEDCNDDGGGQNLGYIDDKDWVEYEVYVSKKGTYKVNYRISSQLSEGSISLSIDGSVFNKTTLIPTFNWQSWTSISSDSFFMDEGIHRIRLVAINGGFNLNWIEMIVE